MLKCLAIIPARGGSKGIPGKNIIPIGGHPLIYYNIHAAQKSRYIERLIVSTDDHEISEVALKEGAEVVIRPSDISGDLASSELALIYTLDELYKTENYQPDILVFLQCTSPLTTTEDIDQTIGKLIEEDGDSALTVAPFHYYLWKNDHNGELVGINHDKYHRPMRQEREKQYIETGAVYVMRVQEFLQRKYRFFGKVVMSVMPEERCFEIDVPADLLIAEQLLHQQNK
ncbi:cytidylyltransferase domain-containing protein [Desulfopila sp. IMCC35008]|uniref:acylneuraminate cytidylyltransferase family protein n=1 Tax=Desulfopila sp. IMCC35008 TaxID=2653858 RepID=UPI0013D4086D|nr:acylneuraminate cytidylyltransferase family protein [Desulfopila sp. IMCC35008]